MAQKLSLSDYLLFALVVLFSVEIAIPKVNAACELATIGGGCPDMNQCMEVCRPCYRGIGQVVAFCRAAGGGIPYDQCICSFKEGAPCSPPGPPRCPGKWPPAEAEHVIVNATLA